MDLTKPDRLSCGSRAPVDRGEAVVEAVAGGAQVQAPDAQALGPGELERALAVGVEALGPVAQRLGVVVAEALDVLGPEAGALERLEHARELQRLAVGKDVALREGAGVGVGVAEPGDAVVEQPAARRQQRGELARRRRRSARRRRARPCRCWRSRRTARRRGRGSPSPGSRPARRRRPPRPARARPAACGSESVIPTTSTPCRLAAWIAKLPQPQPMSSTRSPALERELAADHLELLLLGLLERLRAAREDRAAVGHRLRPGRARRTRAAGRSGGARRRASRSFEWRSPPGRSSACGGFGGSVSPFARAAAAAKQPQPRGAVRAAAASSCRAGPSPCRCRRPRARRRRRRGRCRAGPGARSTCAIARGERTVEAERVRLGRRQRGCRPRSRPRTDARAAPPRAPCEAEPCGKRARPDPSHPAAG